MHPLTLPGAFSFEAKYKYDAWKKLEGKSKDDAKAEYVALLKSVRMACGLCVFVLR